MTFTHLAAVMSKAVPALQDVQDLSAFASVTKALHCTHFAPAASQALAALLPEREVVLLGRHLLKDIDEPQPVYSLSNVSPG